MIFLKNSSKSCLERLLKKSGVKAGDICVLHATQLCEWSSHIYLYIAFKKQPKCFPGKYKTTLKQTHIKHSKASKMIQQVSFIFLLEWTANDKSLEQRPECSRSFWVLVCHSNLSQRSEEAWSALFLSLNLENLKNPLIGRPQTVWQMKRKQWCQSI